MRSRMQLGETAKAGQRCKTDSLPSATTAKASRKLREAATSLGVPGV